MRLSCLLVKQVLDQVGNEWTTPGVMSSDLDIMLHNFIIQNGAYPSPLAYNGYPKSTCISVNDVICHGIPSSQIFKDGDVISVDATVFLNGYAV